MLAPVRLLGLRPCVSWVFSHARHCTAPTCHAHVRTVMPHFQATPSTVGFATHGDSWHTPLVARCDGEVRSLSPYSIAKQCKPIFMARVCKHQLVQLPAEFRFSGCDHLGCTTRLDDSLAVLVARSHESSLLPRSCSQESSLLWHRLRFCPSLALDPANGFSTDAGRPTNVAPPTSLAPAPHAVFGQERTLPSGRNGASRRRT